VEALLRENVAANEARQKSLRHFAILKHSTVPLLDNAIQRSLLPLGTQVLWVDAWPEMQQLLYMNPQATIGLTSLTQMLSNRDRTTRT
jgi:hypothetical protein